MWELALGKLGFGPEEDALNGRIPAVFQSLAPNSGSGTTTALTLVFDRDIAGLTEDDITIAAGSTGATKGALSKTGAGTYSLALKGVEQAGKIAVSVERDGYLVLPSELEAQAVYVNPVIAVEFISAVANGEPNMEPTTELVLKFSKAIEGLTAGDIAVADLGEAATKGALSGPDQQGEEAVYTLALNDVTSQSEITVSASKGGYEINPLISPVTVSYPLRLTSVAQNGKEGEQSTTQLELTFDRAIEGLDANDIMVSGSVGTVKNETLVQSELTYTLSVSGFTGSGTATVTVQKNGYAGVTNTVEVVYYRAPGTPVPNVASITSGSIKEKFGVGGSGTAAVVTATFNELSAFIKNNGLTNTATKNVVKLGDWIDLEGGLTVDSDTANTNIDKIAYTSTNIPQAGPDGQKTPLLRLIVVGINSFNKTNPNSPQHVVFQFQNVLVAPVWMNGASKATGGYASSNMQTYLTKNFLTGLTGSNGAGVPNDVLWAPTRVLSQEYPKSAIDEVTDKLWLPTVREIYAQDATNIDYSPSSETAGNQARLEYYDSNTAQKYDTAGTRRHWLSSRYASSDSSFCCAFNKTTIRYADQYQKDPDASSALPGIAPAFCVGPGN
ncbi:MAG: DUF6273 domain-containing protein [Spirochaetaceae bacterium]|nr:DUF6273 domain-containing protein [Spirochaetaceae bacterium]